MDPSRHLKIRLTIVTLVLAGIAGYLLKRPKGPPPPIAIEDGKTIDFSTGEPVMTGTAEDRAAIEKAKREMEAATEGITFPAKARPEPSSR